MGIAPRLSLVTLGVADVEASTAFYERLGWRRSGTSQEGAVTFFALQGCVLAVFGRQALADDVGLGDVRDLGSGDGGAGDGGAGDGGAGDGGAGEGDRSAFRAVSMAINLESPEAVDAAFAEWVGAGGAAVQAPHEVFWGGYSSYVADPDGHLWEIAHNPHWSIDADGRVVLPG
jgi:uncharacterized protein